MSTLYTLFTFFIALALVSPAACQTTEPSPPDVEQPITQRSCITEETEIDAAHRLITIFETREDMIRGHVTFFENPCDGGLYFFEGGKRYRVAESWRLFKFVSADWIGQDFMEIRVKAEYATGMGPQGAEPFLAEIVLKRRGWGWSESSATFPSREDIEESYLGVDLTPHKDAYMKPRENKIYNQPHPTSAANAGELEALKNRWRADFDAPEIEFTDQRFAAALFILTSGSMRLKDIQVYKAEDGYDIVYTVNTPRIGTADIKRTAVYALLPKDGLPFEFIERGKGKVKGKRIEAKTGVISRLADKR